MNRQNRGGIAMTAFGGLLAALSISAALAQSPGTRYSVLERISGPGGGWDYTMIDSASRRLYLGRDEGVLSMNLDTKKITPVLFAGEGVHAALPVPGTQIVVVTNGDTNKISLFAADTAKLIGTLPAGDMPDAAAFEPKSGLVAVMNHKGGTVTLVDAKAPSVVATVTVGGELEFAAAAGDGRLFVNVADKGEIAVIDVPAHKLLKSFKMKGCSDPSGLAYDGRSDLLISVCGNGVTKFLHADGRAVATLKTGMGSDGLILDADRQVVFVPAGRDGTLAIISLAGAKPTLIQSMKTQKSARLGALDAKTGNVYLPAGKMGPPVPPNPWPTVLPGSFEFLVVGKK